ncbi:glycosyltransferase family 2 protein [Campylobacter sp. RM9334]|uniref:glycosyltransferase family 2 protein n=2 Tax=unclassified Campylobacter TaxID=2593542 RepID=UPI001D3185B7|nr:glycosyltransferase family 2 protein [Campylobacter sp. RM9334]
MSLISIILPTYNVEKYIARALESCINQTLKDIEIIVVDDKGQDKSIDIAYEYANKDSRIKIIHNITNKGTYEARNIGVRNANSELIMFLDPDDELELNACEIVYTNMLDGSDMLCFNARKINLDGTIKNMLVFNNNIFYVYNFEQFINTKDSFWNLCFKCFKKHKLLESINNTKISTKILMAEDALLFYFALANINIIKSISDCIYNYYNNPNSSMNISSIDVLKNNIINERYVLNIISDTYIDNTNRIKKVLLYRLKLSLAYKQYLYNSQVFPKFKLIFRLILSLRKKYYRIIACFSKFII